MAESGTVGLVVTDKWLPTPSDRLATPGLGHAYGMENKDQITGRIKEAAGDLTGNDELKREGKTDKVAGNVKDTIGNLEEKAKNAVDDVKGRVHDLTNKD